MTVKLCGVDLIIILNTMIFVQMFFIYYETHPYSSVHIRIREARIQCVCLHYTFF